MWYCQTEISGSSWHIANFLSHLFSFFLSFFLSFFPNIKCFNRDLLGKLMHNKDHRVNMGAPWYSGYHLCLVLRKSMVQIMVHLILDDCKKEGSIGLIGKEKNKLKRRRGGNWTHYSHYGIGKSGRNIIWITLTATCWITITKYGCEQYLN